MNFKIGKSIKLIKKRSISLLLIITWVLLSSNPSFSEVQKKKEEKTDKTFTGKFSESETFAVKSEKKKEKGSNFSRKKKKNEKKKTQHHKTKQENLDEIEKEVVYESSIVDKKIADSGIMYKDDKTEEYLNDLVQNIV